MIFVTLLLAPIVLLAQDPAETEKRVTEAHRPLFEPALKNSRTASQVTASAVRNLPGAASSPKVPRRNYIDEHIFGRMQRAGVRHAGLAGDEEFARRAWLDATGRIPPPEALVKFVAGSDPGKRDKLIDQLLGSDEYIDRWTYYFEDLFRAGGRMGFGLNLFHYWTREWLRLDRPYNDVVSDLVSQGGKTSFSLPGGLYFARDFVKAKDDPTEPDAHDLVNNPDTIDEFTITYGKVFLGMNFSCISCHDGKHHLEKVNLFLTGKTRENFFQQAGFYGRTRQIMNWENSNQANQEYTVDDESPGYDTKSMSILRVPRSGGDSAPAFILTGEKPKPGEHWRDALARMMTSHIQFGRAYTNRIWAELMGFGIVEPIEDFDLARYNPKGPVPNGLTKQASNPELLDAMAKDFMSHNYSVRHFLKTVMKSSAYQLSSRYDGEWKDEYAPYYARRFVRLLDAAQLHDAISVATAKPGAFSSGKERMPMVTQVSDPGKASGDVKNFMRIFGQSNRDDMPKHVPPSSLQAMMLMQSKIVTERVAAKGSSRVDQLLKENLTDAELVEELYVGTVSRKPSPKEAEIALRTIAKDRQRGAENLQWALINSPEFVFNY